MSSLLYPPLDSMLESGRILREALSLAERTIKPGISTSNVNEVVHEAIINQGGSPAFLGYNGFPACCCISVNEQVVHCIPSDYLLKEGDIISVDCGVIKDAAHTDACRTFPVGSVSTRVFRLLQLGLSSLDAGIASCKAGNKIGDISYSIQKTAEAEPGFHVSREFVGHGIGYDLHQQPWIHNYGKRNSGQEIKEGMYLAIEPIVFDGNWETKALDRWNIVSSDGSLSVHFEDTVYIGKEGCLVLTR